MPKTLEGIIRKELRKERKVSESTLKVFKLICSKWPLNPLGVAKEFGEKGKSKTLSAKYLYHFRKLKQMDLIEIKKLGNTYVVWPIDIEKLRLIHELLSE